MSVQRQRKYLKRLNVRARTALTDEIPTGAQVPSLSPDELVEDPWASVVYEKARLWAKGNGGVDSGSILLFGIAMIKVIEKMMKPVGHGYGEHKISILMTVLRLVIENDIDWSSDQDKQDVLFVLEEAVPSFVKEIIMVSKGEKDIGKLFGVDWDQCCKKQDHADPAADLTSKEISEGSAALKQEQKMKHMRSVRQRLFTGRVKVHGRVRTAEGSESTEEAKTALEEIDLEDVSSMFSFENDPRVAQLYAITRRWAKGTAVTAGSVISYVTTMIGVIQQLFTEPHTGSYKEDVLVTVLTLVLENEVQWEDESSKQAVLALMQSTVPMMVRTAIKIAKGEINLGKMFKNCFPCCFGVEGEE